MAVTVLAPGLNPELETTIMVGRGSEEARLVRASYKSDSAQRWASCEISAEARDFMERVAKQPVIHGSNGDAVAVEIPPAIYNGGGLGKAIAVGRLPDFAASHLSRPFGLVYTTIHNGRSGHFLVVARNMQSAQKAVSSGIFKH